MLEIRNLTQNEIDEKLFQKIAGATLKTLKIKDKIEISLALAGNGRIRRLNKMYRGKNRVTDVLSFGDKSVLPYLARAFPKFKNGGPPAGGKFIEPPDKVKRLGEIVICYPQAKKQAKKAGHSLEKELAILLVHGIMHLAGYEHERGGKKEDEMREMEEKVLQKI